MAFNRSLLFASALALASCGGDDDGDSTPRSTPPVQGWRIEASEGFGFDGATITIPAGAHVNTVTRVGKPTGTMRLTLDVTGEFRNDLGSEPTVALYFQRKGDDWSGRGAMEAYRWYAKFAAQPLKEGRVTLEAPMDGAWSAVQTSTRENNPNGFLAAQINAERVGFVLGGGSGMAHGVWGEGTIRIVDFTIG